MKMLENKDWEGNWFSVCMGWYVWVGMNVGGIVVKVVGVWLFGFDFDNEKNVVELVVVFGGLKGLLMKVV